jgi:hypothetical protein
VPFGAKYIDDSPTEGFSGLQTADGGFVIVGAIGFCSRENYEVWLLKTDSEGKEEWDRTFGGIDEVGEVCVP